MKPMIFCFFRSILTKATHWSCAISNLKSSKASPGGNRLQPNIVMPPNHHHSNAMRVPTTQWKHRFGNS